MVDMHISLFGKLKVCADDQLLIQLEPRRVEELLGYLLLYRDRLHDREKLATLLWPDTPPPQSKRNLRQTLWQLQSGLNHLVGHPADQRCAQLLRVDHAHIGVNPDMDYWLDVAVFERAFAAVKDKPGRELCEEQAAQVRQAVQLYQGDLLEGWYQDWCIYERERYQNLYLAMLDKLLGYSETHAQYEAGVAYGEQILRYDHAREQTHRKLMRLHYQAGNRTAAIHQYELCVASLQKELEVSPAQSTVALYWQICHETGKVVSHLSETNSFDRVDAANSPGDLLQQLAYIQTTLAQLQAQVGQLTQALVQQQKRQL